MKKKNITIDDLARMVQKEFNEINQKLGKLDRNDQLILKRLEGVVYRTEFEKLEIRVAELENLGWDEKHGCYAIHPVCIVVAESFENAAETVGGEFAEIAIARHEKTKSVVSPKSLYKEMKVLQIMELPFFEQEFIELLSTTKTG